MSQEFKIKSVIDLDPDKALEVIREFKSETEKLKNIKINLKVDGLDSVEGKMKELIALAEKLQRIQRDAGVNKNSNSSLKQTKEELEALNKYKDTYRTIQKLKQQQSKGINNESFARTQKEIDRLKASMDGFRASIQSVNGLGRLQLFDDAQENSALARMEGSINKLSEKAEKLKANFNSIEFKHVDIGTIESDINRVVAEVERLQNEAQSGVDLNMDIGRALNELSELNERFDRLRRIEINGLRDAERDARRLNSELSRSSRFMDEFKGSFASYTLGDIAGDFIVDGIRGIVSAFGELDKGMTNIKKVANPNEVDSKKELKNIQSTAIQTAKAVGQSSSDVMNAISDTLQAGIGNMKTSMEVARQTMMFANVGELSQETTSSAVNTMIKGFNIDPIHKFSREVNGTKQEVTGLENAMDLLNFASNNYGASAQQLVDGMQNGANVLGTMGVSLEDTIGLMTAGVEVLGDGNKVGNGLKSIGINLQGIKTSAKTGELSLNKTAKALSTVAGIDVYSDKKKGQLKSMTEILDEVQSKWSTFTDEQKAGLSEAIAGKQQASVFQAIMQNYKAYKKLQGEFGRNEQFGSMQRENEKFVDSVAGKLNRLKETWISIGSTMITSNFLKGALDGAIGFSEGLENIIKLLDKFKALTPTIAGIGMTFNKVMRDMAKQRRIEETRVANGGTPTAKTNLFSNVKRDMASATQGMSGFAKASTGARKGINTLGSNIRTMSSSAVSSIKTIGLSLLSNLGMMALLSGAIMLISSAYKKATSGVKEQASALREIEDGQKAGIQAQQDKLRTIQTTGAEYEKLRDKANKTAEEEQKMLDLGNELAEVMPNIKIGEDENGNAIISMTKDMKGYADETQHAIDQQNRLMLGTRLEQSDNALKMLTKGELSGKDALGLNDQKIQAQKGYNDEMVMLQNSYNAEMYEVRNSDGKKQREHMENARQIRERMITSESEYMTKYSEIQGRINEKSQKFRDTMSSIWQDSATLLPKDLLEDTSKGIEAFTNSMDFSQINSKGELGEVKRIFRELPKLAQDGTINMESLNGKLADINEEFSKTGNIKSYNKDMQELANSISKETGWDASVLTEMFTQITNGSLKSKASLDSFLDAFGSSNAKLQNGDAFAKGLQQQFASIQTTLDTIGTHDFGNVEASADLVVQLKEDKTLPKQVNNLVGKMEKAGVGNEAIITVTGQVLMALQDGKVDPSELESIKQSVNQEMQSKLGTKYTAKMKADVEASLDKLNTKELTKEIKDEIGKEKVKKDIKVTVTGSEKAEQIKNAIELLESRPDVNKSVNAVVDGEEELIIFDKIIRNLPTDATHTNKFIVDNAEALSKMETYEEVLAWIDKQPKEFKTKYGLETEGLEEGKKSLDEIDKKVQGEKVVKIKAPTDDVLKSIKDVETLIKYSSQIEKGKYKIEIDAKTQDAVDQLGNLEKKLKSISNVMKKSPTMKFKSETAGASQNITGLINKINQAKSVSSAVKTVRFRAETALASQNITGLIAKIKTAQGLCNTTRTARFRAETALASQNITGLINKIKSVPTGTKTITYKVVTAYSTSGSPTSASKGTKVQGQSLSAPSEIISAPQVAMPTPQVASPQVASMSASISSAPGVAPSPTPQFTTSAVSSNNMNIGSIIPSFNFDINMLSGMESELKKINNQLDILDKKSKDAFGSEKISYLNQQNELYRQQQKIQHELAESMRKQQNELKYTLSKKGFSFNSSGDVANDSELLLEKERYVKSLEERVNADTENTNEGLKKHYEEAKEELETSKKYLSEYINLTNNGIPECSSEWMELQNKIEDANLEIFKTKDALTNLRIDIKIDNFNNDITKTQNEVKRLDILIARAFGSDKQELIDKRADALRREQSELHSLADTYREQASTIGNSITSKGFIIDKSGQIQNEELLESFKGTALFDYLKEQIKEYNDLVSDKIPSLGSSWWELENDIEDSYREQLKVTKDIQDKIIDMKRKEVEEKKKLIDEDLDNKTTALEKEKDAYNRMRKEIDYKDDVQEQKDVLSKLQKDISIAQRDTSIGNQARLKELLDKQEVENKKLQDMVQSNIDEQVNNSIDDESKRLKEQADKRKENLDNQYTDENLRKMADESLQTGTYTDINGKIIDLQDAMLTFENQFGDGMSAMGGIIKSELVTNLESAKNAMKDMDSIMNELDISKFSGFTISDTSALSGKYIANNNSFSFNQPLLNVQGNITADIMPRVEQMIKTAKDELTRDIVKKMQ